MVVVVQIAGFCCALRTMDKLFLAPHSFLFSMTSQSSPFILMSDFMPWVA